MKHPEEFAKLKQDPAFTGKPDDLNITQSDARYLAFEQGIYYCLGAPLVRLEGEIAFTTLVKRLPGLRLADPKATLEWRPAF